MANTILQTMQKEKYESIVEKEDVQILNDNKISIKEKIQLLHKFDKFKYTQKWLANYFILNPHRIKNIVNEETKIKDINNPIIDVSEPFNSFLDLPRLK